MNLDDFLFCMTKLSAAARVYEGADAYINRCKMLRLWIAQYGTADE